MKQRLFLASGLGLGLAALAVYSPGCSAGTADGFGGESSSKTTNGTGATDATGSGATQDQSSSSGFIMEDAGPDAPPDVPVNPCGTECPDPPGSVPDKCDGVFRGLDDNCNGQVDEGCSCTPGEASSCFKGDPSYRDDEGCAPGTEVCNELGQWGDCLGGQHATDNCFLGGGEGCHAISGLPFQTVSLGNGTGNFDDDADPGSSTWELACPMGVMPCPVPDAMGNVQVLASGEYTVTYSKTVGGNTETCSYPLYVGARGLRVELSWNYPSGFDSVDLDLHLHQPNNMSPWSPDSPLNQDCMYSNCPIDEIFPQFYTPPTWFPAAQVNPDDPVSWFLDPLFEANTCYFAPRGKGAAWQQRGQGCHNPRLDLDNVTCDPAVVDPEAYDFCAPENINVDFPPKDTWMRIGVYGYGIFTPNIKPVIKVYCDGALAAELGPQGFNSEIVWSGAQQDIMWSVADVAFAADECGARCVVKPIYVNDDEVAKQPLYQTALVAESQFTPPYPPPP